MNFNRPPFRIMYMNYNNFSKKLGFTLLLGLFVFWGNAQEQTPDSTVKTIVDTALQQVDAELNKNEKTKKLKPEKTEQKEPKSSLTKEQKKQRKADKKYEAYVENWRESLIKSDRLYDRGSYTLCYGRMRTRLRRDKRISTQNAIFAIDLAKTAKYLHGKGDFFHATEMFDSSLVTLKRHVTTDDRFYKEALTQIADGANEIGRSADGFLLLLKYDSLLIDSASQAIKGKMLDQLNKIVAQLDDTLIVPNYKAPEKPEDKHQKHHHKKNSKKNETTTDSTQTQNVVVVPPLMSIQNDSALFYNFLKTLINTQLKLGYYQQADFFLTEALRHQELITKKKIKFKHPVTGKKGKDKIKRRELKHREYDLASLYVSQAQIQKEMGNYPAADSLFHLNKKKRIKKLVGKKSSQYFENYLGLANMYVEDEEYGKAGKIYEKLRKKLKKTNKVSSYGKLFYAIKEGQTLNYINLESYGDFKGSAKKFIDVARVKYSKKSPYFLTTQRVYDEGLYYKNARAAQRKLNRTMKRVIKEFPEYSIEKIPYNNLLFKLKRRQNDLATAKEVLLQNAMIYKTNYGDFSPMYHQTQLKIAEFQINFENNFNDADEIFKNSFDIAVTNQFHPYHRDYYNYLLLYADLLTLTDRFDFALEELTRALAIVNLKYGKNNKYYGMALEKFAGVLIKKGEFQRAEDILENALDIVKDDAGRKSLAYINSLRTLAELYSINGKFDEAEKIIKRANRLSKKLGNFVETANVTNSEDLANLYIETGRYDDAESILNKTLEIRQIKFGNSHYQLIKPNSLLGKLYLLKGDFVNAEKVTSLALNISSEILSDTSTQYLSNAELLAKVYTAMGSYEKAAQLYTDIINQNKKMFGDNNIAIVAPTLELAIVYNIMGNDYNQTVSLLENIKSIVVTSLGNNHPLYADIAQLQAQTQIYLSNFGEAEKLLNEANNILITKFGNKYVKTADNVALQGDMYYEKGDFSHAIEKYRDALSLYKSIFNNQHPKYVSVNGKLARAYYASNDLKRSLAIFDETTNQYLNFIHTYFPALSDNEKSKYWSSIRTDFEVYASLALKIHASNPEVLVKMFNDKIATKAILLSSSIKVKQRVLNSGDEELIDKYDTWVGKKELLTRAISMSKEELQAAGINPSQLEKDINELEKELSEKSEAFADRQSEKQYTIADVKNNLKPNETLVEIIRFRYFDKHLTDSVIYAALILNKETKKAPKLVIIPNGNDLEGKYFKYYRNVVKYKTTDKNSYDKFWAAIDKEIPNGHTVIISPDGIYNQVNVETFQLDNENFMFDKNNFYLISNPKDIPLAREKKPHDKEVDGKKRKKDEAEEDDEHLFGPSIVLFGNPDFGKGKITTLNAAKMGRVSSVDPLPGAEEEVKQLTAMLDEKKWRTSLYVGENAEEHVVKNVESPRVFHVATHGFFMDETPAPGGSLLASADNPLLKSGLMFTGASELIEEDNIYNLNKKDGILTAYEAMNLPLDNTELVVLSACETGLGEIKAGEGVFGLQRAFLVAGAQNVIMTLFKVNDTATQELMNFFYAKWLETGDKRLAFNEAKKMIKEKYDSPIYWGSFIMIGLDE